MHTLDLAQQSSDPPHLAHLVTILVALTIKAITQQRIEESRRAAHKRVVYATEDELHH